MRRIDSLIAGQLPYLPLPVGVVLPINALQRLSVPSELVVAGVRVDDGRAIIAGYHLLRARLCLAERQSGREEHERGRELHGSVSECGRGMGRDEIVSTSDRVPTAGDGWFCRMNDE